MPFGRSNLTQTAVTSMSTAVALALLGLVLAYWTWAWVAPVPLPPAAEVSESPGRLTAAGGLFGQVPGDAHADTPTGLAVKLLGVIAGQPEGSGYALLQLDEKKTRVVRAGNELAPGIRVESVLPQQVILQRHGSRETLAWPHPVSSSTTAASVSAQ